MYQIGDIVTYEGRPTKIIDIDEGEDHLCTTFLRAEDNEWWFGMDWDEILEEYGEEPVVCFGKYEVDMYQPSTNGKKLEDLM